MISVPQRSGDPLVVDTDEHPRTTDLQALSKLKTSFRQGGSAAFELAEGDARHALAAMCIGVGQGNAVALESV